MGEIKKYKSLDMPLKVYLNAYFDGDTSECEDFEETFTDYCIAIGGKNLQRDIQSRDRIARLRLRVSIAESFISVLTYPVSQHLKEEAFNELLKLGYPTTVESFSIENAQKLIKQIDGYIRLDVANIMLAESTTDKNKVEEHKVTRDSFAATMVSIMRVLNITITEDTSLRIFCQCVPQYRQHCEFMSKQNTMK